MRTLRAVRGPRGALAALSALSVLALSACAGPTTADVRQRRGGDGPSVPYGATKEQYRAAFADLPPLRLNTQSPSPKGSPSGKNVEDYLKAITDWSGGKITFEVAYANAIAPPAEIDDALLDGRLDLGQILPIYEPSEYPASAALVKSSFVSNQAPLAGTLQSNAWPNEVAFRNPEIRAEYKRRGIVPIVPQYDSGANALFCREPRRDMAGLKGMVSAAGGQAQAAEIESLGGSAVTVPYTELFEGLQRGTVDCSVSSLTVGVLGGFIPSAPHITVDPAAGLALAPGGMAISQDAWNGLPKAARQLMWDRLDIFLASNIRDKIWPNIVKAVTIAKKSGGSVQPLAPDARAAIARANAGLLRDLRRDKTFADPEAFVRDVQGTSGAWLKTARGFSPAGDVAYADFDRWYKPGKVDLNAYVNTLYKQVFLPHRPS
ncbi:hypothetical protein GCM10010191_77900 [Actinomadura vinacea]|uniref:ABC transporter substrate-binding protein n=1 Tax=Actinomadura vinacea TaxID=115336 RepID=A0ABN3K592_9ACTN